MADLVTVSGGSKVGATTLTAHEHQAALQALNKLKTTGGVSTGVASALGGTLRSATTITTNLVGIKQAATFAGGVTSTVKPSISAVGSDTVVAGSAFTKTELAGTGGKIGLSTETIKAAGVTAASVKSEPTVATTASHTITMSDKTSITLSGISTHDVIKH